MLENIIKNKNLRKLLRYILNKTGLLTTFFNIYSWYQNRDIIRKHNDTSIYNKEYILDYGYDSIEDLKIKKYHAIEIDRLLKPKKVLVAGCANGNAVIAFHEIGVQAYGFDIIPSLLDEGNPVKKYLKQGSILKIPFSCDDGFDTFVCSDVFEHIYMKDVPQLVDQIYKMKIKWMALIICHNVICPGHVTLKSITWWGKQLKNKYHLCNNMKTIIIPGIYGLDPVISPNYFTFWERIENCQD